MPTLIKRNRLFMAVFPILFIVGCLAANPVQSGASNIKQDETVEFFRTSAWQDKTTGQWHVPIHGWIYEPQNSTVRKKIFATVMNKKFDLKVDAANEKYFDERVNLFIADNERGKVIYIKIAGKTIKLPASAPNGHFETVIKLDEAAVAANAKNNILSYSAVTRSGEKRRFAGEVLLVPPTGFSVISDIDDTIKVSFITDTKKMLAYTFLREFEAAPGMPQLYRDWQNHNTAFHFVSSSPWYLYPPLRDFVDRNAFPKAAFSLKYVRFRDETFFNMFKKGTETKPAQIEPILRQYPDRKFILVGDSGEQDPEVYAGIYRRFSKQIIRIFIRNVNNSKDSDARYRKVFAGIDKNIWQLFTDTQYLPTTPEIRP
ncbi:MAG: DUF2183 domain-containing protein [Gammaproteobacteria bacterium]|nr:DUF2183 domain-containing protein [Gammaproteobacteria bacterium]MDH5650437.1 DUF2183 domain-containing protein [Gammaproteobacteria bacterium]